MIPSPTCWEINRMDFNPSVHPSDHSIDHDSAFTASWLTPGPNNFSHEMNTEYFSPQPVHPSTFDEHSILADRRTPSIPLAISTSVPLSHLQQSPLIGGSPQSSHHLGMSFSPPSVASHWPSMLARRNSFQPLMPGGPLSASSPLSAHLLNSSATPPILGQVLSSAQSVFPAPTLAPAATISSSKCGNFPSSQPRPTRQAPTPRKTLTDSDRKRMCEFHEQHPSVKQTDIGAIFGVERSTVSKVLRLKDKYLRKNDDPLKSPIRSPIRKTRSKPSDVERALATWSRNQEDKRGKPIEDEELHQRYVYFANLIGCVEITPKCDQSGWAESFRQKNLLLARPNNSSGPATTTVSPAPNSISMSPTSLSSSFSPGADVQDVVMGGLSPPHISSIDARLQSQSSVSTSHGSNEGELSSDKEVSLVGELGPKSPLDSQLAEPGYITRTEIETEFDDLSGLPLALRPESLRAGSQSPHFPPPPSIAGSVRPSSKKASPPTASLPPLTTTGLNPPTALRSAGGAGSATSQKAGISNSTPLSSSTTEGFRYFQSPMTPSSGEAIGSMLDVSVYPLTPNGPAGLMLDPTSGSVIQATSYQSAAQNALFKQRRGNMGPPAPVGVTAVSSMGMTSTMPSAHMMFGPRRANSFAMGQHVPSPLQQSMPVGNFSTDSVPSHGEARAAMDVLIRYLQSSQMSFESGELHHMSRIAERLQGQTFSDSHFGHEGIHMDVMGSMSSTETGDLTSLGTSMPSYHQTRNMGMHLDGKLGSPGSLDAINESGNSMFEMESMHLEGMTEDPMMLNSGLGSIGSIDQNLYMNSGAGADSCQLNSAIG